jgi:hypothetical protein
MKPLKKFIVFQGCRYRPIPPLPQGKISANVIWGKQYEKGEKKKEKT